MKKLILCFKVKIAVLPFVYLWASPLLAMSVFSTGKSAPEPKPQTEKKIVTQIEIIKITITDFPAWNSSYERQLNPEMAPSWTLTNKNNDFKTIAMKVVTSSKINKEWSFFDFVNNKAKITKRPQEEQETGASPARTQILIELNTGHVITLGEYPVYEISEPLSELIKLTKAKGVQGLTPS